MIAAKKSDSGITTGADSKINPMSSARFQNGILEEIIVFENFMTTSLKKSSALVCLGIFSQNKISPPVRRQLLA
jgi:hypothetical protein